MAYVYTKVIGGKNYYYLRASKRVGKRIIAKDIAYLGSTLDDVRKSLNTLPKNEIRAAHKNIQRFLDSNTYLEKAKKLKLKHSPFLNQNLILEVEACRLHWKQSFGKHAEKTKQEILKNFIIDFVFNTTSLEGNTLTLKETAQLLIEQLTPKDKALREIYDIQNTQRVFSSVFDKQESFTHKHIITIHKELMTNIDDRTGYRTRDVRVLRARFEATPAPYIKDDIGIVFDWLKKNNPKMHPLVVAGVFHHKFEKIHPFFDGNGRTGRILLNEILLSKKYPPLIVRKKRRGQYLVVLERADKSDLKGSKPEHYMQLIEFLAIEFVENYWNNFL